MSGYNLFLSYLSTIYAAICTTVFTSICTADKDTIYETINTTVYEPINCAIEFSFPATNNDAIRHAFEAADKDTIWKAICNSLETTNGYCSQSAIATCVFSADSASICYNRNSH